MNSELQERIILLWDELADMDAARFGAVADHLMTGLCELVDAQNAVWIGSVRLSNASPDDPMQGWRTPVFRYLHPTRPLNDSLLEQMKNLQHGIRVDDAIYVAFPINEDAESWFGVFRERGRPGFTTEERDTLAYALRGLKWFHRKLMLSHGLLIASQPLTPAERQVLQLLLARASKQDIGRSLGLTANSVQQHVVSVFRKFGVNSRAALLNLWLRATWVSLPPPPPENENRFSGGGWG
jgi:DNA-binding CsgD family transcriptional regulator